MKNQIEIDRKLLYCVITFVCLLVLFLIFEFFHGETVSYYFYNNYSDIGPDGQNYFMRDTGMDFFHSIEYLKGSDPYGTYETLYPPLANAFFMVLYHMIPDSVTQNWASSYVDSLRLRGMDYDLRTWQASMVIFEIFIILCVLGLIAAALLVLRGEKHAYMVGVCTVFSYGVLYAFERGNIIILTVVLSILFLVLYDDENSVKREIGLLCLALAAGLKLYPAILGLLLITDKKYKESFRAIIYGISTVVLPCFLFKGGLSNLTTWFDILLAQVDSKRSSLIFFILAIVLLAAAFLTKEKNHRILFLTYILVFVQPQGAYIYSYFIIPLLFMLKSRKMNKIENAVVVIMMLLAEPMPYFNDDIQKVCIYCLTSIQLLLIACDFVLSRKESELLKK